jgi:hypothetical protein
MDIRPLPFRSSLKEYQKQAEQLFKACESVDPETLQEKDRPISVVLLLPPFDVY